MPPRPRFLPLGWFCDHQSSSQGQCRWKSKMPNPLHFYALGFCLAKLILVPAGRGQEVDHPGMISGCMCVPVCAHTHVCRTDWRFTTRGASYQILQAAHILTGKVLRNPHIFFLLLSPHPSPTAGPLG